MRWRKANLPDERKQRGVPSGSFSNSKTKRRMRSMVLGTISHTRQSCVRYMLQDWAICLAVSMARLAGLGSSAMGSRASRHRAAFGG